ncbi:SIS domain-containing protein [Phycicoccus sp. HDW14]|uniref:D-sedoheptulose-7-phosphate isomerase n=1 Tax=Phycicoccus sp. HDW14 TaxID=2714941 RepID=UPI001407B57B|nr:SIS domain-containing protein [Phycicoccus sp. HDW14]QIM20979.1 SIS domain-containing protein [Phycicoccus sp. HDW14]
MTAPDPGTHVRDRHAEARDAWRALGEALAEPGLVAAVDAAGSALVDAVGRGGAVLVAGNGGSAAIASHVATEFAGRCVVERRPLPSINLAESTSGITALANDYGFDEVFARGVRAHGRPGDVLVVMSTSGRSRNVLAALEAARGLGLLTIALGGGDGGDLPGTADHVLLAPTAYTPRVQEVHLVWTHAWCEAVDHVWCDPT